MYLTRMYLNPARRSTRDLLSNPQKLHAAVLSSFPRVGQETDAKAPSEGRVLYRVDKTREETILWIVSPDQPSLDHLQEQAGWPGKVTWKTADYTRLLDQLDVGQRYAFRLTASPTRSVSSEKAAGGRGQKVTHVTQEQKLKWLTDREERLGARLSSDGAPSVRLDGFREHRFKHGPGKAVVAQADYVGVLEVTDPDALRAVLVEGIGRSKAYGCGLLTLAAAN